MCIRDRRDSAQKENNMETNIVVKSLYKLRLELIIKLVLNEEEVLLVHLQELYIVTLYILLYLLSDDLHPSPCYRRSCVLAVVMYSYF